MRLFPLRIRLPRLWFRRLALAASHCLCQQALDRVGSQSALSMLNAVFASRPGRDSWSKISRAYNTTVSLADGTSVRFVSRERPKLLMGADGRPAYLSVSCWSQLPTLCLRRTVAPQRALCLESASNVDLNLVVCRMRCNRSRLQVQTLESPTLWWFRLMSSRCVCIARAARLRLASFARV